MCVDPKPEVVWVRFFACVVQNSGIMFFHDLGRGRIFHSEFWETRPYKPAHIRRTIPLGSGESQYLIQRALTTTLTRVL